MVQELINSVTQIVRDALEAAGNLTEDTLQKYVEPALQAADAIYNYYLAAGLPPEEAADKTEAKLRELTGEIII